MLAEVERSVGAPVHLKKACQGVLALLQRVPP